VTVNSNTYLSRHIWVCKTSTVDNSHIIQYGFMSFNNLGVCFRWDRPGFVVWNIWW